MGGGMNTPAAVFVVAVALLAAGGALLAATAADAIRFTNAQLERVFI
jgi:hypothetical protein